MFVDTHTHLYSRKFDRDRGEVIQRALDAGVEAFYIPNIDRNSIEGMLRLEEDYPQQCFAMMGLHPCSVKDDYREELAVVDEWLHKRDFCAVGEIGIDLYWDKTYFEQQREAFLQQVEWAKARSLPIVIHSRESIDILIELLREVNDERLRGIFHCFTGNPEQAEAIIDLGFHLGIGGVLTFKNAGLDKTVESIPLKHLVLETDSPYLAPVPYRGRRNESAYVVKVAERLAEVKKLPLEEVGRVTRENSYAIFGKSGIFIPHGAG
jgi:TatD DNase family protein